MGLKYGFFLGCIMPNRYPGIEVSTRKVAAKLGIELVDLNGASCCPAPGVIRSFDYFSWLCMAARNLMLAEQLHVPITVVCNGCYGSLKEAADTLREKPDLLSRVNEVLSEATGKKYYGTTHVTHLCYEIYEKLGVDKVASEVVKPAKGLKVGAHYGCHILRPARKGRPDNPEVPTFLDELIEALGAESIYYKDKLMCCGAGGGVRSGVLEVALDYTREKIKNMMAVGADCTVDICPFCHYQLDRGQVEIKQYFNEELGFPVLHWMQLAAVCLGVATPKEAGFYSNAIPTTPVLKKLGFE